MDLLLDDDQTLMVDTFRRFFAHSATPEALRSSRATGGFDRAIWAGFVKMGGLDLATPDLSAGTHGSLVDAALVAIESGRGVVPIPYSEVMTAHRLIGRCVAQTGAFDPGDVIIYATAAPGTELRAGGRLVGRVTCQRGAGVSRYAVIPTGDSVAIVDLEQPDVEVVRHPSLGGMSLATIQLRGALPVQVVDPLPEVLAQATADLRVLRAAELVGAAKQAIDLAVAYTKQRRQFGRAIASFQAVQHRLVDCRTAIDAAELLVLRAASYQHEPDACRYFSAVALLQSLTASERAATESLQFHGGYGYIVEQDLHLYLRFVKELGVLARDPQLLRDALPVKARSLT